MQHSETKSDSTTVDGFRTVAVGNLEISECRLADVKNLFKQLLSTSGHNQIATVNLSFLRMAEEDESLAKVLQGCRHCFADGWPVLRLAQKNGYKFSERVTGSDLTPLLASWAAEESWRIGFVGGSDEIPDCAQLIHERFSCEYVGHWCPTYTDKAREGLADPQLAAQIAETKPDILLVALGSPKQEFWLAQNLSATGAKIGIGVGASLDFLCGNLKRAPKIFQKLNLEFLYRWALEPRRLSSRYWADYRWYSKHKH
jgi:N-acetylglucosaminyldiphosphoundecaprenol N-acetyl-beta-D-mannosaminyltransferase